MYKRYLETNLPGSSFFLFGPRQVGKTTLLGQLDCLHYADLLDPEERLAYTRNPSLLSDRVLALPEHGTVIIDEVQRAPALLDIVQILMQERPRLRFIMSGSSARKLRRGVSNLLGGRALYRTLHPLTVEEMEDTFDLESVLSFGSLPRIRSEITDGNENLARDLLRSYVTTYVTEEVIAEALVRNLQGFQSFLEVASEQFAQQVNFAGVSRDCRVAYETVRQYYSILEDTLIGFFLQPHVKGARKRMSRAPRFYFFDNGVTRAMLGTLRSRPSPLERGRLFEQWFVQEVHRLDEYHQKDWKLTFWRTSHGAEVDLLIEAGGRIIAAIECKHRKTLSRADLSGLRAFHGMHESVPCYVVAPIDHAQKLDFADAIPPLEMLGIIRNL